MTGKLSIVATPIGNLEDITLRALRTLREADLVCAEDTRHTRRLLDAHGIAVREIWSLHEHNEPERMAAVLGRIREGAHVALVSDAGTPLVSDPGFPLVRAAAAEGLRVEPIPGACAAVAALSASGLPPEPFLFAGFPPKKPAALKTWIEERLRPPGTFVMYIPARDAEALAFALAERWPDAPVVLARELTKLHETFHRATLSSFRLSEEQHRGEATMLVHIAAEPAERPSDSVIRARLSELTSRGLSRRDAATALSVLLDLPKREVTALLHGSE